jgi:U3 small nucleolar RNA-associated protein 21
LDGTIRTWDLSTGYLVDWFVTSQICTGLAFSPDGSFLATTHVDQLGIFLWTNRAHYTNVSLRRVPNSEPVSLHLPGLTSKPEEETQGRY